MYFCFRYNSVIGESWYKLGMVNQYLGMEKHTGSAEGGRKVALVSTGKAELMTFPGIEGRR